MFLVRPGTDTTITIRVDVYIDNKWYTTFLFCSRWSIPRSPVHQLVFRKWMAHHIPVIIWPSVLNAWNLFWWWPVVSQECSCELSASRKLKRASLETTFYHSNHPWHAASCRNIEYVGFATASEIAVPHRYQQNAYENVCKRSSVHPRASRKSRFSLLGTEIISSPLRTPTICVCVGTPARCHWVLPCDCAVFVYVRVSQDPPMHVLYK